MLLKADMVKNLNELMILRNGNYTVIKQAIGDKLHIEFNSITKLFHPYGIIRYCKDISIFGKKVNLL